MRNQFIFFALTLASMTARAQQTYVPPPPPRLPEKLSEKIVKTGKDLFERNVFKSDQLEIHNYLGKKTCASCHDQKTPLQGESLAQKFPQIRDLINKEITEKCQGAALPREDPAMEALVQFLMQKYGLHDYKLLK